MKLTQEQIKQFPPLDPDQIKRIEAKMKMMLNAESEDELRFSIKNNYFQGWKYSPLLPCSGPSFEVRLVRFNKVVSIRFFDHFTNHAIRVDVMEPLE